VCDLTPPERLAELDLGQLTGALAPLFEDNPWLAGRLLGRRFRRWDAVVDAAEEVLADAPDADRKEALRSHPRLGEPSAILARLSPRSWREQGAGRVTDASVLAALASANQRYEARFGFPFVDWVAGRPLGDMVAVIDARLSSDPRSELARGCRALVDIARDRLNRIAASTPGGQLRCPSCS
jgi:2-oxo-4-hydroxy-4-carboxy--5-ureidoimidazoline (OHCU) decarboxylase